MESFNRPKLEKFFNNLLLVVLSVFIFLLVFAWFLPTIFNVVLMSFMLISLISFFIFETFGQKEFKKEVSDYLDSVDFKLKNSNISIEELLEIDNELTFKCWDENGMSITPYGVEALRLLKALRLILIHK